MGFWNDRPEGTLKVVAGRSRSGKTCYVKADIHDHQRILAWDIERDYEEMRGFVVARNKAELIAIMKKAGAGACRIAYQTKRKADFDFFCRAAMAWVEVAPLTMIAEELADVTTPAKAPDGWGECVRKGMKRGLTMYAVSQRPAEADKTSIGNAKEIICFHLTRAADRKYMAAEMDLQPEQIAALETLQYIRFEVGSHHHTSGKIEF